MNTYFHQTTEAQSEEACDRPAVGALLPDYIVELLDEATAEKVEDHLLACLYCKERYLTVLRLRGLARRAKALRGDGDGHAPDDMRAPAAIEVPRVSDFNLEH